VRKNGFFPGPHSSPTSEFSFIKNGNSHAPLPHLCRPRSQPSATARSVQKGAPANFKIPKILTEFSFGSIDRCNKKKLAKSAPSLRFNIHVPSSRNVLLFSTPSFFLLFYALILAVNLT
jgi:hypothetical protein